MVLRRAGQKRRAQSKQRTAVNRFVESLFPPERWLKTCAHDTLPLRDAKCSSAFGHLGSSRNLMMCRISSLLMSMIAALLLAKAAHGGEPLDVWPQLAPGESTRQIGEALPP